MDLVPVLIKEGFDKATAQTVVQTADSKPIDEAKELLESMLGAGSPLIEQYAQKRQRAQLSQQLTSQLARKVPSRIVVNEQKQKNPGKKSGGSEQESISTEDKIDGVKELEAAIKQLSVNAKGRTACDCMGSRHGLLEMAPNCLKCGRVVCNKEGLGPCLFCGAPLLPTDRIKQIRDILSTQKNEILTTMSKKALHQLGIDPKTVDKSSSGAEANLERLLGYQAHDSERTRIIDRVGEVDLPTPAAGKWMTPDEQAAHIRQQQRKLRQLEKQRRANMDSSRKVISIDMQGKKTYQRFTVYQDEDVYISSDEDDKEDEHKDEKEKKDSGEYGDDQPKAAHYYDPKKFEPPKIPLAPAKGSLNDTNDTEKPTVIRSADEDLLY